MAEYETLAAVDLGSNSFHMVIAQTEGEQLKVIDRIKEMVRLAAGLDHRNRLDPRSRQRALDTLERFGERLRPLPRGAVRIVGTNTLRKARNSRQFLLEAEQALGHPVEIISGSEEARLIYLGVAHSVERLHERRLVMDIGGGSTEFIVGTDFDPSIRESKYMGCVSYSQRYFENGALTRENFKAAEISARQELQASVSKFREAQWDIAIGASGTIRAIREIAVELGFEKADITLEAMRKIRAAAIACGSIDDLDLPGLSDRREPVFPGGLAILIGAFKSLGIERMTVSDGALREGVLYDLQGRIHDHDVREETIRQLASKYHADPNHAARVQHSAQAMLDDVRAEWRFDHPIHDLMLRWASTIHEIGLTISHSRYHKHGSYLVENSDMPGFSRQDQQFLWALVRSHRRRFKVHRFDGLPDPFSATGPRLAVLLRLAVVLNRSRDPEDVPGFDAFAKDRTSLHLEFVEGTLERNPLTRADLEEEADYLDDAGFSLTFA